MNKSLVPLGKMTVFYVPSNKLDDSRYYDGDRTARTRIHEFLVDHFRAYTLTPTPAKGFWIDHEDAPHHDVMERYEVSFQREDQFEAIIEFLVGLSQTINEDSIYATRGDKSYLVRATVD